MPPSSADKIKALQTMLAQEGIDAWLVPSADPHQRKYAARRWGLFSTVKSGPGWPRQPVH